MKKAEEDKGGNTSGKTFSYLRNQQSTKKEVEDSRKDFRKDFKLC